MTLSQSFQFKGKPNTISCKRPSRVKKTIWLQRSNDKCTNISSKHERHVNVFLIIIRIRQLDPFHSKSLYDLLWNVIKLFIGGGRCPTTVWMETKWNEWHQQQQQQQKRWHSPKWCWICFDDLFIFFSHLTRSMPFNRCIEKVLMTHNHGSAGGKNYLPRYRSWQSVSFSSVIIFDVRRLSTYF